MGARRMLQEPTIALWLGEIAVHGRPIGRIQAVVRGLHGRLQALPGSASRDGIKGWACAAQPAGRSLTRQRGVIMQKTLIIGDIHGVLPNC